MGCLSRMVDVVGNVLDRQGDVSDVEWKSVHRAPPSLSRRSTATELFETGIKIIDVLVPLERGGKARLFGGAGIGKTSKAPCHLRKYLMVLPYHTLHQVKANSLFAVKRFDILKKREKNQTDTNVTKTYIQQSLRLPRRQAE
ncbi:MAG: vacuolar-type H+-ATPase catalytic subunit A/Vma1 [Desulforhopalus sp.]|jgi:vacuolar-type H+-ATPase catalytic subunit A/Vma1